MCLLREHFIKMQIPSLGSVISKVASGGNEVAARGEGGALCWPPSCPHRFPGSTSSSHLSPKSMGGGLSPPGDPTQTPCSITAVPSLKRRPETEQSGRGFCHLTDLLF